MKIGLIGVPGSGKTALAEAIQSEEMTNDFIPIIIDQYAETLADPLQGDWAIGMEGGYLTNLVIALKRHSLERAWWDEPGSTITCGTVIESSVYMALHFQEAQKYLTEADRPNEIKRIQASMEIFACLFMDTFKYDQVYYLPPMASMEGEEWRKTMDQHLQAAFQAFGIENITPLAFEAGSNSELLALRLDQVKEDLVKSDSSTSG